MSEWVTLRWTNIPHGKREGDSNALNSIMLKKPDLNADTGEPPGSYNLLDWTRTVPPPVRKLRNHFSKVKC